MGTLVIITAVENRKSPCGTYTSYPPTITVPHDFDFDEYLCNLITVGTHSQSGVYGLAINKEGVFVKEYDGWCMGSWANMTVNL